MKSKSIARAERIKGAESKDDIVLITIFKKYRDRIWSAECEICHTTLEISHMDYDPEKGWICIDCEAATKPASFFRIDPSSIKEVFHAGVQAAPIEVRA